MKRSITRVRNDGGSALILAVGYLMVVSIFATTFVTMVNRSLTDATKTERRQVCLALAEAGLDKALAELRIRADAYRGENNTPLDEGRFCVEVTQGERSNAYYIVSTGELVDEGHSLQRARVTAEVALTSSGAIESLSWSEVKRW